MDKQIKIVGKHSKDCFAINAEKRGTWKTCWGPIAWGDYGEPIVTTTRRYGKKGTRLVHWIRVVCNDPSCKAELHIREKWITEQAGKFVAHMQAGKELL